jgi:hypothetical protein
MTMINYDEILSKIVAASTKNKDAVDYLKIDIIGNTITGRFLPNFSDVENSVWQMYHHGWTSKIDNSGIFQLCPNTNGQRCPTCKASISMWKGTDPVQKEDSKQIRRRQNWVTNFYVISDIKHPENNGTVQLLKFGKQIHQKYEMATKGDDKDIYGSKILRLDEQGCSFRIKCEQNSDSKDAWPTYTNSGFLPQSKIDGMTEEKIKEIYGSVKNLTTLYTQKSYNDLLAELNKHFFSNDVKPINASLPTTIITTGGGAAIGSGQIVSSNIPATNTTVDISEQTLNTTEQSSATDVDIDAMISELQTKKD